MPYIQRSAPTINTLQDLRAWVEDELGYIEQAQHDILVLELKPSFQDVTKPRDGMIVYADGVHFNPGGGAGSYEYRAGTWHKLADDIDVAELESDITDLEAAVAGPSNQVGFTNGSEAPAGDVGEYKFSFRPVGTPINVPGSTDVQVTSLTLPAGDWDIWGEIFLIGPSGDDIESMIGAINTTISTNPVVPTDGVDVESLLGISVPSLQTGSLNGLRTRANITSSITYLLVIRATYSAGSGNAYGALRARRMR